MVNSSSNNLSVSSREKFIELATKLPKILCSFLNDEKLQRSDETSDERNISSYLILLVRKIHSNIISADNISPVLGLEKLGP